MSYQRSDL